MGWGTWVEQQRWQWIDPQSGYEHHAWITALEDAGVYRSFIAWTRLGGQGSLPNTKPCANRQAADAVITAYRTEFHDPAL